jgi:hypothetical protein
MSILSQEDGLRLSLIDIPVKCLSSCKPPSLSLLYVKNYHPHNRLIDQKDSSD